MPVIKDRYSRLQSLIGTDGSLWLRDDYVPGQPWLDRVGGKVANVKDVRVARQTDCVLVYEGDDGTAVEGALAEAFAGKQQSVARIGPPNNLFAAVGTWTPERSIHMAGDAGCGCLALREVSEIWEDTNKRAMRNETRSESGDGMRMGTGPSDSAGLVCPGSSI